MKEIKLKTETFKVLKIKIVENNLVLSFPNSLPERPQDCFVLRIMPNYHLRSLDFDFYRISNIGGTTN